jgi:F-type H+-transporting ATPase subunit epsilon
MVFDGDAYSVSLPTTEGSVGILANHSNVIMAVIPGLIEYEHDGDREQIVVSDGLLKVENGEVMILVDTAEKPEDIDEARAKRAEEEAREALKKANSNRDHAMVEAELSRALSRIKASKTKHSL